MSADFWLRYPSAIPPADPDWGYSEDEDDIAPVEFNITYNLSEMFAQVSGGLRLSEWFALHDGKRAREFTDEAAEILARLEADPSLSRFNASNGWGTYAGLLKTWRKFVRSAQAHPDAELGSWL